MLNILLHLIPTSLYAILSVLYRGSFALSAKAMGVARVLLVCAVLSHGFVLTQDLFATGALRFGLADALSLTLWLTMLIYTVESIFTRLDQLLALAAPFAAVCAFLPVLLQMHSYEITNTSWLFRAHFIVAMLAYGFFTLAALHALAISIAEKQLHRGQISLDKSQSPPLLTLEKLLFRLIGIAFFLLTLTISSGMLFSEQIFHKPFVFNHKVIFTIASWLLFGILLAGRYFRGWRGKIAQRWTLMGFACLLLAYVGTRFVLELLLNRS